MTLPFDGAISRYFREGAPKDVRKAIEKAGIPLRLSAPHKAFHRNIGSLAGVKAYRAKSSRRCLQVGDGQES